MNEEPEEGLRQDEQALGAIHSEIAAERIKLYRNVLNQPYVICNYEPGSFASVHLHLFEHDFRSWLTHFIWKTCHVLLSERELSRIQEELAGRSMSFRSSKIQDIGLMHILESEPVAATVFEFMQNRVRYETTMHPLWELLFEFAQRRKLWKLGKNRFPGGSGSFGSKLRKFLPVLEQVGIDIELKRSNGSKVILSRRSDDSDAEPSTVPSAPKADSCHGLPPLDDKTANILRLRQRKETQSKEQQ